MIGQHERREASWDRTSAKGLGAGIDVPPERRFVGFDAYRKAMDCLSPGDVAILATPPAFRWVHFGCAIEKGLNVFKEIKESGVFVFDEMAEAL